MGQKKTFSTERFELSVFVIYNVFERSGPNISTTKCIGAFTAHGASGIAGVRLVGSGTMALPLLPLSFAFLIPQSDTSVLA